MTQTWERSECLSSLDYHSCVMFPASQKHFGLGLTRWQVTYDPTALTFWHLQAPCSMQHFKPQTNKWNGKLDTLTCVSSQIVYVHTIAIGWHCICRYFEFCRCQILNNCLTDKFLLIFCLHLLQSLTLTLRLLLLLEITNFLAQQTMCWVVWVSTVSHAIPQKFAKNMLHEAGNMNLENVVKMGCLWQFLHVWQWWPYEE